MNDTSDTVGLTFTLLMMGVLLVICVVAVVIFFRVWRRENKGRGRNFFE